MSTIERPMPPLNTGERTTLESWLDFHRATDCALADTGRFMEQDVSLRWIYVHMIEE